MWFSPQTLSIITTHRCTAACEHCCFACSPGAEAAIPLARLQALVEETAEVPSIRQVVFTGGECFLLGPALDTLIRRCRDLGLGTRCVSNGYWAHSLPAAEARVAQLRAAGLEELNLSTGVFHARFVPWERVLWGAAAAASAGLGVDQHRGLRRQRLSRGRHRRAPPAPALPGGRTGPGGPGRLDSQRRRGPRPAHP